VGGHTDLSGGRQVGGYFLPGSGHVEVRIRVRVRVRVRGSQSGLRMEATAEGL